MKSKAEALLQNRVELDEINRRLEAIQAMTVSELREEYERVFDEPSASRNRRYLVKRICYRVQEIEEGGLSQLARRRIDQLARNAPIRRRLLSLAPPLPVEVEPPTPAPEIDAEPLGAAPAREKDARLPAVGTVLRKVYREAQHDVTVLDDGFEMEGKHYRSLSGVARAITGTAWNGFLFFERELARAKAGDQ